VDTPPKDANYPIGTVAMAKTGNAAPGTSGSQFFVVTADGANGSLAPNGIGQYAIVGHVTKGMDVIQKIAGLQIQNGAQDGAPVDKVYIVQVSLKIS
jgi:peptidyl-prolyl cis-trans isomerase B (cyclophilin B)